MNDWLVEDIDAALGWCLQNGIIVGDVKNLALPLAEAFRNNLEKPSVFLEGKGVTLTSREYLDGPFIKMAKKSLQDQLTRETLAAKTISVDKLGGMDAFSSDVKASLVAAYVRERVLMRYLEELGPPGSFEFDPFGRFLILRGKKFEAELLGSFSESTWLWSTGNLFLNLEASMVSAARRVQTEVSSVFATTDSVHFGRVDPLLVQTNMAAFAVGIGAGYICNGSQTYGIMPGQLPAPTILDFQFEISRILLGGTTEQKKVITESAKMLGFEVKADSAMLTVTSSSSRMTVDFDENGRVSKVESV